MTVKEVLCEAAKLVGESDVYNYLSDKIPDDTAYCEEGAELIKHCYDVIIDELACEYLPLKDKCAFAATDGKVMYSSFVKKPVRINFVYDENGKKLPYKAFIDHLSVTADKVIIEYDFKPGVQNITDEAFYADGIIGEHVLAYGVATEYCTERGRITDAEIWASKYNAALKARLAEKRQLKIKAGRWC